MKNTSSIVLLFFLVNEVDRARFEGVKLWIETTTLKNTLLIGPSKVIIKKKRFSVNL